MKKTLCAVLALLMLSAILASCAETTEMDLEQLKLFDSNKLTNASIWSDAEGEYYIYLNEWNVFRHLPELSSYDYLLYFNDNCMVVNSETATISVISLPSKHDEPTILTYHLNKDNKPTEVHTVLPDIMVYCEEDIFLVNMHNAEHGYFFLTSKMYGRNDDRMDRPHDWPLFMFETTDGGKSWNQITTNTFYFHLRQYIDVLKFVSPQVGIISSRDMGSEELFDRTYLTVDGGLTWNLMPELPHFEFVKWYSEVIDFEYDKDTEYYYLTVQASNYYSFQLRFYSKDLINWDITSIS